MGAPNRRHRLAPPNLLGIHLRNFYFPDQKLMYSFKGFSSSLKNSRAFSSHGLLVEIVLFLMFSFVNASIGNLFLEFLRSLLRKFHAYWLLLLASSFKLLSIHRLHATPVLKCSGKWPRNTKPSRSESSDSAFFPSLMDISLCLQQPSYGFDLCDYYSFNKVIVSAKYEYVISMSHVQCTLPRTSSSECGYVGPPARTCVRVVFNPHQLALRFEVNNWSAFNRAENINIQICSSLGEHHVPSKSRGIGDIAS